MTVVRGRYRAKRLLEKTGKVAVYVADCDGTDVALYIAEDKSLDREAFQRGAEALKGLPGDLPIARLLETGECTSGVWAATEYNHGRTWTDIARGQLPGPLAAPLLILELAAALASVQRFGLAHGALGPHCVVITHEGQTKIAHYGLASLFGRPVALGPRFRAPEHLRTPLLVDARTDVYGVGITLLQLFTAASPPHTDRELTAPPQCASPEPLNLDALAIPGAFRGLITRATAEDPAERYSDVAELELALLEALSERSSALAMVGLWPTSGPREVVAPLDGSIPSTMRSAALPPARPSGAGLVPSPAAPEASTAPPAEAAREMPPAPAPSLGADPAHGTPAAPQPNREPAPVEPPRQPRPGLWLVRFAAALGFVAVGALLREPWRSPVIAVQATSPGEPPPVEVPPAPNTVELRPAPSPPASPPAPSLNRRAPGTRRAASPASPAAQAPPPIAGTSTPPAPPPSSAPSGSAKRFPWEISDPCALAWYRCNK